MVDLDDLSEPAAVLDGAGQIEECNQAWLAHYPRRNVLRLLAEAPERRGFAQQLAELMRGQGSECSAEFAWSIDRRVRARARRLQGDREMFLLRLDGLFDNLGQARMTSLVDQMQDAVFLLEPVSGRTLYANAALLALLELEQLPADAPPTLYGSIFGREFLLPLCRRLSLTGPLSFDVTQFTSTGRRFPARLQVILLPLDPQPLLAVVLNDRSETTRQMLLLQSTGSRLEAILESSPVAVVTLTAEGLVSSWNPAAEKIYGWTPEEVLMRPSPFAGELSPEVLREVMARGATVNLRLKRRCKDGDLIDISLSLCSVLESSGKPPGLMEVGEDITDHINADRLATNLRMVESREAERLSLAREIHDGPLQELLVLGLSLGQAWHDTQLAVFPRFQLSVTDVSRHLRSVLHRLRPAGLDEMGLVGSLESLVERLARDYAAPPATCLMLEDVDGLNASQQLCLFRIVQEAYQNCLRHAQAQTVELTLRRADGQVELVVADDGQGFHVPASLEHFAQGESYGLLGMQERTALCGGSLSLDSRPGLGTRLTVLIPAAFPQEGTPSALANRR